MAPIPTYCWEVQEEIFNEWQLLEIPDWEQVTFSIRDKSPHQWPSIGFKAIQVDHQVWGRGGGAVGWGTFYAPAGPEEYGKLIPFE